VKTKFSKSFTTFFFPVGEEVRRVVEEWVTYLRQERLWGNQDPLFPATRTSLGFDGQFVVSGVKREHWRSAAPIRGVFKEAFQHAGFTYFNPHSFRKTLVQLGETYCRTPEEFKAWSQNLGHEAVLTTFRSYGAVSTRRQGEILGGVNRTTQIPELANVSAFAKALVRELKGESPFWP